MSRHHVLGVVFLMMVGCRGEMGRDGELGPQGPQGLMGPQGMQGPQGPQGMQGPAGADAAPVITANNKSIASVGVFCGATVPTDGKFTTATKQGPEAAKELCESVCGSPTAHMCTGHDMSISLQVGLAPTESAWIDSWSFAGAGEGPNGNGVVQLVSQTNCFGWRDNSASAGGLPVRGSAFAKSDSSGMHYPAVSECNVPRPIACCDNP